MNIKSLLMSALAGVFSLAASAAYIELDSITCTGAQAVNTDYRPQYSDKCEMNIRINSLTDTQGLFCSRGWNENDMSYTLSIGNNGGYRCYIGRGVAGSNKCGTTVTADTDYVLTYDGYIMSLLLNGTKDATYGGNACNAAAAYYPAGNIALFGLHQMQNHVTDDMSFTCFSKLAKVTFCSFKIWNRFGKLVRWFVPVEDTSVAADSPLRYGVYDKLTGRFCKNLGTAAFTPGSAVADAGWVAVTASGVTDGAMDPVPGVTTLADGDSFTATATDYTNEVSGVKFTCTGYTIQTCAAGGEWSDPVLHADKSVTFTQDGTTKTRIVWQWERGVRVGTGDTWVAPKDQLALMNTIQNIDPSKTPVLEVESGYYLFDDPINIRCAGLTLKSATGNPADVVFDGQDRTRLLYAKETSYKNLTFAGLTLRNARVTFTSNYAGMESFGGAIRIPASVAWAHDCGDVVTNCIFSGCHSDKGYGGAISMSGGAKIVDCTFTNCTALLKGTDGGCQGGAQGGGALHLPAFGADALVERCAFLGCCSSNGIGVIGHGDYQKHNQEFNEYGIIVRNCGFTNNWSWGGRGCISTKCRLVDGCTFKGNSSRKYLKNGSLTGGYGGVWGHAVEQDGDDVNHTNRFVNCTFEENWAGTSGGVFYMNRSIPVYASNCVFRANAASQQFACSLSYCSEFVDCEFTGHYSFDEATVSGYYCGNFCTLWLGSSDTAPRHVRRCWFHDNRGYGSCGSLSISASDSDIIDCTFEREYYSHEGHKVSIVTIENPTKVHDVTIRGCLFANCTNANSHCTAVLMGFANGNSGNVGITNGVVESCTFVGLRGANQKFHDVRQGTIYMGNATGNAIRNCIFSDNLSGAGAIRNFGSGNSVQEVKDKATYCWEDGTQLVVSDATHNIRGSDPKFVDAANFNYRLKGNACANKGLDLPWMQTATDLDGKRRILGPHVDFGCYERDYLGMSLIVR